MRHSFIVTTCNIQSYIGRCLDSLRACTRPGDEIIVIDDGSIDGTAEEVEAVLAAGGFGADVALRPILLGVNTMGGVGIPGNIGLTEATGEAVFFVDGDDWLEPAGFNACRNAFETSGADILIGNYLEYDEAAERPRHPADARHWRDLPARMDETAVRRRAIALIAVPWRKFYRRDFLQAHGIRFPEGDFFFEDNPFHWQVCEKAARIAFHDRILCHHRINRPGQTMASTGVELAAFFTHYETIRSRLPADDSRMQQDALAWLLNNMSWHDARLEPQAYWPYAQSGAQVLMRCPEPLWQEMRARFAGTAILGIAETLRRGDVAGVIALWGQDQIHRRISEMDQRLSDQADRLDRLEQQAEATRNAMQDQAQTVVQTVAQTVLPPLASRLDSLHHIMEFRALRDLARLASPGQEKDIGS